MDVLFTRMQTGFIPVSWVVLVFNHLDPCIDLGIAMQKCFFRLSFFFRARAAEWGHIQQRWGQIRIELVLLVLMDHLR
jgi:hypothetical protein